MITVLDTATSRCNPKQRLPNQSHSTATIHDMTLAHLPAAYCTGQYGFQLEQYDRVTIVFVTINLSQ